MMFFLAFTITLTGCGEKGLKDNPATNEIVISNGGMSVIKGDYLYFVNGYVSESSLTDKDNKAGHVTKGAIYRTKLENGEIVKDKDGFLLSDRTDRVVSKVVGFGVGGFYIIDDYIIYATPYRNISSSDESQTSRVEFHRVNIDGTGDKTLFVTTGSLSEWTTYKIGDTPYLVCYESNKIVSVNVKTAKTVGSVDSSASHAIFKDDEYNVADTRTNLTQKYVVYTRAVSEDEDKVSSTTAYTDAICAFNIATGESTTLELTSESYTIKHVTDNTIYFTKTSTSQENACLYKKVIESVEKDEDLSMAWKNTKTTQLTNEGDYEGYLFVDGFGVDLIVANDETSTWLLSGDCNKADTLLLANCKEFIAVYGDYAYYTDENKLFRVNITSVLNGDTDSPELESVYPEDRDSLITDSNYLDFDGRRVYVYSEYTAENEDTNYYLNYFNERIDDDNEFYQRFVGVFESDDIPAKPDQPEAEEGEIVEYVPHID